MNRAINFQTVSWFWDLHTRELLDLDPPYQRRSVWNQDYKDFFIDTVLNGYPAPAIFLYQEITPEGISKYSVVDGKQRLSTLFEFAKNQFSVSEETTVSRLKGKYFKDLETEVKQNFWKYQFAVEYLPSSEEGIINNIFNRINRNVIKLTPQELRHAKFNGLFVNAVEELTDWMNSSLPPNFPSIDQRSRKQMKDVELVAQLLFFLEEGTKSYNQDYLDQAFSERDLVWDDKDETVDEFKKVIESIKELLDKSENINLSKTRLKNQADFYSLFGSITELKREGKLHIGSDVANRIYDFLEVVGNQEKRDESQEALNYYNAAKVSFGDAGPRKTRISILKSVIQGNIL